MTQPTQQTLTHVRGDTFIKTASLSQPLTSFDDVWFTVRESYATTETDDSEAVAKGSIGGGEITGTGSDVTIELPDDTTTWQQPQYVWDLQVKTTGGKIYTAARGMLRITPDVTRST
jgi:hypothetical protein